MSKSTKQPFEMTDAEFERYLKRHRITGLAAAHAATARRRRKALIIAAVQAAIANSTDSTP